MDFRDIAKRISKDPSVFWDIIDTYEEKLLKYIMRITDIAYEDAENLLQEIFIKVYKNIYDYDERFSFSSWIYRIAHNHVIDNFRKNEKNAWNISLEDEEYRHIIESLVSEWNPHLDIQTKDIKECVAKAISKLPWEYREVIVLKYLEDYSYEEISDILKIPVSTAWTLINRAKQKLKAILEDLNCII